MSSFAILPLIAAAAAGPSYVAKVNGDVITRQDVRAEFKRRHGGHERMLADVGETRKFIDHIIDRRLLLQEAYRLGLDERPEARAIRTREERARGLARLTELEIDARSRPSDAQVQAFYDEKTTTLFEVRQIVTASRPDAEAIRAELASGGDFDKVARARSIGHSRAYGGRLPLLGWGAMDPAWEAVVFALQPGDLAPVIESAGTFEVVQLVARKSVDRPPFAAAAGRIRAIVGGRLKAARERAFSEELWVKYHVQRATTELGPEALARAAKDRSTTAVATWDGQGRLTLAALAASLDVPGLAKMAPSRQALTVERALRQLVNEELAVVEARARHLERDPAVAAAVRDAIEDAMEEILYDEYVLKDATVTEDDIARAYAAHRDDFKTEPRWQIAHIVVATEPEAVALRARLVAGEPFAELARSSSTDRDTAKKGGSLGLITRSEVPRELEAVLQLRPDEVSAPLHTQFGWHLMKVVAIVPPRAQALDEVREELRRKLKKQKVDERRGHWVKQLRGDARIEVNDAELRQLATEVLALDRKEPTSSASHPR
jgi:parvulin-like peptidyl-prolyl isomerase